MTLNEKKIGFLGAGKMASAIIKGLLKSGIAPENISAGERWAPAAEAARKEFGIYVTDDNADVVQRSDILLIAVKPKDIEDALSTAGDTDNKLFISIAAGVTIETLEKMVGIKPRVIRVMPNICATVLQSATGISRGTNATDEDAALAMEIFSAVGVAMETPESLLNAVTGLSGSGPAYVFQIIEAMADGGVFAGLDRKTAQTLAAQTVLGAAAMVIETGQHPGELKDMVCSPGGTTIEGVAVLEHKAVRAAFMDAVIASAEKSEQLGKKK
ncbi:Pyrroline-5-carboxylate reductase [Methanimicrococcus sp. At1]|uniref:Pyrroline-5-carboxylate reductase n=1 Tax=Methanimicrococcus hacksteinii TaxID=3028293 RepID=A0ABU3VRP3_9EURY|nr:pyrroline-5-carboxylate reductase [Methanimicrococcus sp. At1]MDV0446092.1 Pyrroline-5-carboxylate reductase [Methanimicrococcus sp. At1]